MQSYLEKNSKILITGYTGFIGRAISFELLKKKLTLYGINKSNKKIKKIKKIKAKINSIKFYKILKKEKIQILIHTAWETNHLRMRDSVNNKKWYYLSVNLIKKFFKYGGKKVICLGSSDEYYRKINKKMTFFENSKKFNTNIYAKYKIKLYNYLKKKYPKKYVWLRVFWLFGKNENKLRLIPQLILAKKNKKRILILNPNYKLDYLNVEVAAKIITKILLKNLTGCFNIASGKNYKISKLCKLLDPKLKYFLFKNNKNYLDIVGSVKKLKKYNAYYNYNILKDFSAKV